MVSLSCRVPFTMRRLSRICVRHKNTIRYEVVNVFEFFQTWVFLDKIALIFGITVDEENGARIIASFASTKFASSIFFRSFSSFPTTRSNFCARSSNWSMKLTELKEFTLRFIAFHRRYALSICFSSDDFPRINFSNTKKSLQRGTESGKLRRIRLSCSVVWNSPLRITSWTRLRHSLTELTAVFTRQTKEKMRELGRPCDSMMDWAFRRSSSYSSMVIL